jgi:hypothetical protein
MRYLIIFIVMFGPIFYEFIQFAKNFGPIN